MDEGSTCFDDEYQAYKYRFNQIFDTSHLMQTKPKVIFFLHACSLSSIIHY